MEIFDDKTYEILAEAYENALENGVRGALLRAVKGEMPFVLKKEEKDYSVYLNEIACLNEKLLRLVAKFNGQKIEIIKSLLKRNKEELPQGRCEQIFIELKRYENACLKVAFLLIEAIETAKKEGAQINDIFMRSYCVLSLLSQVN